MSNLVVSGMQASGLDQPILQEATLFSNKSNTMEKIKISVPKDGCAICLEPLTQSGRTVATCEVKHLYHKECLSKWFEEEFKGGKKENTCPTCRTVFPNVSKAFYTLQKSEEIIQQNLALDRWQEMMASAVRA